MIDTPASLSISFVISFCPLFIAAFQNPLRGISGISSIFFLKPTEVDPPLFLSFPLCIWPVNSHPCSCCWLSPGSIVNCQVGRTSNSMSVYWLRASFVPNIIALNYSNEQLPQSHFDISGLCHGKGWFQKSRINAQQLPIKNCLGGVLPQP